MFNARGGTRHGTAHTQKASCVLIRARFIVTLVLVQGERELKEKHSVLSNGRSPRSPAGRLAAATAPGFVWGAPVGTASYDAGRLFLSRDIILEADNAGIRHPQADSQLSCLSPAPAFPIPTGRFRARRILFNGLEARAFARPLNIHKPIVPLGPATAKNLA